MRRAAAVLSSTRNVLAMGAEDGIAEGGCNTGRLEQRQPVGDEAHLREKALW